MSGRGYTIFDTGVGRCGIAWGDFGVLGVQLPEAREIETRRRLFHLSGVTLDMTGIHAFDQRVYELTRAIPRGETRTYGEIAKRLGASGAVRPVAQAISRNPFIIVVPCHRVLEAGGYADRISPNGGSISKRRLLSIEGARSASNNTLFDVLLPVAPPRPQR